MSSDNRANYPSHPPPIYTVYPGGYQGEVNYGLHPAPPPKYEDAVKGLPTGQPQHANEEPRTTGVLLISPVYMHSNKILIFRLFCIFLFIVFFLTVIIKYSVRWD